MVHRDLVALRESRDLQEKWGLLVHKVFRGQLGCKVRRDRLEHRDLRVKWARLVRWAILALRAYRVLWGLEVQPVQRARPVRRGQLALRA